MFDNFLIHTFHDGNCLQAYKIFGAHFETHEGKKGVRFTTYAPNARSAQVVGEFNQWGETPCYMERYNNGGIYTIFEMCIRDRHMTKPLPKSGCNIIRKKPIPITISGFKQ